MLTGSPVLTLAPTGSLRSSPAPWAPSPCAAAWPRRPAGGAVIGGETWWCALEPGRVLAVGGETGAMRLRGRLDWHRARRPELEIHDLADRTALQLVGSRAGDRRARGCGAGVAGGL
jgi:hypothetical protein